MENGPVGMSTKLRGHARKAVGVGIQRTAVSAEYEITAVRNLVTEFLTE
jgi:hypothetical protein